MATVISTNEMRKYLLLIAFLIGLHVVGIFAVIYWVSRDLSSMQDVQHGQQVSVSEANRHLPDDLQLPDSARNVSYFVSNDRCQVMFSIRRDDFWKWCRDQEWVTEPIPAGEDGAAIWRPQIPGEMDLSWGVQNGHYFYPDYASKDYSYESSKGVFDGNSLPPFNLHQVSFWAHR